MASKSNSGKVSMQQLKDMVNRVNVFKKITGRDPKTVSITPPAQVNDKVHKIPGVPYDHQDNEFQCATSSLQMLLNFYNCPLKEPALSKVAHTDKNGTPQSGIAIAVAYATEKCKSKFVYSEEYLEDLNAFLKKYILKNIPVIVHLRTKPLGNYKNDYGHYVVLCGYGVDYVIIHDPTKGVVNIPKKNFENAVRAVKNQKSMIIITKH